jgi:hypothetical protein
VDVLLLLGLEYRSGTFFVLGASVLLLRYCIVAKAGCNWYLFIVIYFEKLHLKTQGQPSSPNFLDIYGSTCAIVMIYPNIEYYNNI